MCADYIYMIYMHLITYIFIYICMHVAHVNKYLYMFCYVFIYMYHIHVLLVIDHASHVVCASFVSVWP